MNEFLQETYKRLLSSVSIVKHRYLFHQLNMNERLTGIIGARGVGKTTLMLQFIKQKLENPEQAFYVSADSIYFNEYRLIDFVKELYEIDGIRIFFIDEIHRYPNWNQELKNIYDAFPEIHLVFSGSSSIDLVKGSYDLSRRAKLFYLQGLSFREYLYFVTHIEYPVVTYEDILMQPTVVDNLAQIPRLKGHFQDYLAHGYYPFQLQDSQSLYEKLLQIIDKTIYEDIADFYKLKTENLSHFKKILNFLGTIPPGEFSINNLARNLHIDHKTAEHYLQILSETGLARLVILGEGGNQLLRKPSKAFIHNTTLFSAINSFLNKPISIGALRELFFLQSFINKTVFYSKLGDYQINHHYFEVGGKNKSSRQLQQAEQGWIVKDDILYSSKAVLPLYLFGFLY